MLWVIAHTECFFSAVLVGLLLVMTCLVVGYSMLRRVWLGMVVVPLMVAIVLSMVSELDNPRTGLVRVSQQSMLRAQQDLKARASGAR